MRQFPCIFSYKPFFQVFKALTNLCVVVLPWIQMKSACSPLITWISSYQKQSYRSAQTVDIFLCKNWKIRKTASDRWLFSETAERAWAHLLEIAEKHGFCLSKKSVDKSHELQHFIGNPTENNFTHSLGKLWNSDFFLFKLKFEKFFFCTNS